MKWRRGWLGAVGVTVLHGACAPAPATPPPPQESPSAASPSVVEAPLPSPGSAPAPPPPAPAGSAPEAAGTAGTADGAGGAPAETAEGRWCAPELEALAREVCAFVPKREMTGKRTLVVFLHGVIQPDTGWQWAQQRGIVRAAAVHGFTVIMPRGRVGHGPKGMESWWTWPTGAAAQASVEDEILPEWEAARTALERRSGQPFERVWVFGFSNGGYYATSLAMRGRLAGPGLRADGFAAFAGGGGANYLEKTGRKVKARPPFFVGWGDRDPAHKDQVSLARMLRRLGWPSKSEGARRAGHVMTDQQAADAVHFLAR